MREIDSRFPSNDTVFEYCVDPSQHNWLSWDNKLSANYRSVCVAVAWVQIVGWVHEHHQSAIILHVHHAYADEHIALYAYLNLCTK